MTTKSINSMSALTELGLITKPALCEMISECSCFLVHPNLWIRQAVVGFITTTTKVLPVLDVQCKIMPNLAIYMKYPLIQIDKYVLRIFVCVLSLLIIVGLNCYWSHCKILFQEIFMIVLFFIKI